MQTSPTAPKQTLLPHDRGGQLALLPTGEDGGSNGQRRAHASSSGHVTQTKAKMATATTANLTERAAGETESLATVVAAVEVERGGPKVEVAPEVVESGEGEEGEGKGEVSEGASEYSPGRRRKKKAKIIMSATAQKVGSAPGSPAR